MRPYQLSLGLSLSTLLFSGCFLSEETPPNQLDREATVSSETQVSSSEEQVFSSEIVLSSSSLVASSSSVLPSDHELPTEGSFCVEGKVPEFLRLGNKINRNISIVEYNANIYPAILPAPQPSIALEDSVNLKKPATSMPYPVTDYMYPTGNRYDFLKEGSGSVFFGDAGFIVEDYQIVNEEGVDVINYQFNNITEENYKFSICGHQYTLIQLTDETLKLVIDNSLPVIDPVVDPVIDPNDPIIDPPPVYVGLCIENKINPKFITNGQFNVELELTEEWGGEVTQPAIGPLANVLILFKDNIEPNFVGSYLLSDAALAIESYQIVEEGEASYLELMTYNGLEKFEVCPRHWHNAVFEENTFKATYNPNWKVNY